MHALWALLRQCVKARTFAPFDLMKGLTYRHAGIQATYLYRGYRNRLSAVEKPPRRSVLPDKRRRPSTYH